MDYLREVRQMQEIKTLKELAKSAIDSENWVLFDELILKLKEVTK